MSKTAWMNLEPRFQARHIGPSPEEQKQLLKSLDFGSMDSFIDDAIPPSIRVDQDHEGFPCWSEAEIIRKLKRWGRQNQRFKNYIGLGYHPTHTPSVIQRNILENPGWYTQYTPYQAEISQGRLEALLNFQTMVQDLTALPIANASLLDEATAAAEAMAMFFAQRKDRSKKTFFVSEDVHPQTIAVIQTRAKPLGIEVQIARWESVEEFDSLFGALIQYPNTDGAVVDYTSFIEKAQCSNCFVVCAADLMSLVLLKPPGEMGVDACVGNTQRFGVALGFGGPHAAFFATTDQFKRKLPGRIVGVSKDRDGKHAYRLALQTREQHIRREKATSNICTAQVLLAIMASMYAIYHGPEGLRRIARKIHFQTVSLASALEQLGFSLVHSNFFDTLLVSVNGKKEEILASARSKKINLRDYPKDVLGISLHEAVTTADLEELVSVFDIAQKNQKNLEWKEDFKLGQKRESDFLTHPVFHEFHSETEMLRYIRRLESKDLSLNFSMIPLGSCTMKLNATTEMLPVTWPEFAEIHPFAPSEQTQGYQALIQTLETRLCEITGFDAVSMQPNAGSQGEYAGLLVIRAFHEARGESHRKICLIPTSAHGTNPASAVMSGFEVVPVRCDDRGNIDLEDLREKSQAHSKELGALMVTYPSTHGVFEEKIREICGIIHEHGGQVYMDGANMNAQVGLCRPSDYGPDVCHLNLHKTFCIPHGGGGPGMGPICVKSHLKPFLPTHPIVTMGEGLEKAIGPVSAAPWGSPSILPISYAYIEMMGSEGLKSASEVAILNANYIAQRLNEHYPILYRGEKGLVAHECIIDLRPLKALAGIEVEDVAKRLMDYGYHAPTMSWPVAGTMMIEPTESETKAELDRFCDAMIAIREEIKKIETGDYDRTSNPLKNAPHTATTIASSDWDYAYTREQAVYPLPWVKDRKFWPSVSRIDGAYGDRNLVCSCPPWGDD